ncbi:MAG: T9SS type A sorting domain-containing protein, partial [Bacteroidota bacterium]
NSGPDDAVNIFIDAQLPDSLSFTSKAASVGDWNNFFQYWYVPFIASGETATLQLTLFTLSRETPITFFAQIIDVEQDDPDSSPNNNTTGVPVEDDEASITITPMGSNANALEDRGKVFGSIYPVPTTDILNINVNSTKERPAVLSIIDLNGTLLRQLPVDLLLGDNNFQFEVADLSAGMYYLYLTDQQNQLLSWQFVKVE